VRRSARAGVALLCAVALGVAGVDASAAAGGSLRVAKVDQSRFPNVVLTLSSSTPITGTPSVTENGSAVSGVFVERSSQTADTCIAIDSSQSMTASALHDAIQAATQFSSGRRSGDKICIETFGQQAQSLQDLTGDSTAIATALQQVGTSPKEGTALYDAVVLASSSLASANDGARKVLVLLTDGADSSSKTGLTGAVEAARNAGVTVYGIQLETAASKASRLAQITSATGGKLFDKVSPASIADVYARIGSEVRSSVRLDYVSHHAGAGPVSIAVSAAGHTSASATYTPAASAAPVAKASSGSSFANLAGRMGLAVGVGLAFLFATLFVLRRSPEAKLEKRLAVYTNVSRPGEGGQRGPRVSLVKQLVASTDRVFAQVKYWKRMGKLLEQADLAVKPSELFYIQLGASILLAMLGTLVLGAGFATLVLGIVGFAAPFQWVKLKANKRRNEFEAQLGDTLLGAAASLRAGHSFAQAIASIVKDGEGPVAKEFARVENETRLGLSTDVALDSMAERLGSKNFEFVVIAVNIQRQVGGSLAEILDMVADTVRSREQFSRKVKALTAMGRASAYVLIGMPFIMGGLIELVDSKYMRPLLFSTIGHVMIGVGLVSMSIGTVILRKIVNFKY
jgi:tight adherence protein B